MAEIEAGIREFVRRVDRAVKDLPEAKTPEDFRELRERLADVFPAPVPWNFSVRDRFIHVSGRIIAMRIYRPEPRRRSPGILFFHGGGFVSGSTATHDVYALGIAEGTGLPVVSVNYRLAPENPYPAAVEDAYHALAWIVEHADRLGLEADRLAVGGDSAGGALTAAVTLMARDRGGPAVAYQYLVFPVLDTDVDTGSYLTNAADPFLTRDQMIYYWNAYLEGRLDTDDGYAVPMRAADLSGLPPAYILTAEHDPLRDEGERYGTRLAEAGVAATVRRAPGAIHGFLRARFVSRVAEAELEGLCRALREGLGVG